MNLKLLVERRFLFLILLISSAWDSSLQPLLPGILPIPPACVNGFFGCRFLRLFGVRIGCDRGWIRNCIS